MAANSGNRNVFVPDKHTIFEQTITEAIHSNFNSVQKWSNWKEEHENLKKTLRDLPNKLVHPGVIPFGSRALVKADIIHTNEVLSSVGDGYFIKQSAKQAIDMCDRRIKESEKMLEDLEKERLLFQSRQTLPQTEEAFASEDQDEIIEEYDEEKEMKWRARHREMEKKYRQELAELRKKRVEEGPVQTEEDLFRRLDMLELEEEYNDELERLDGVDSNESVEDSDEEVESDEEDESEEREEKQDRQEKELSKKIHNTSSTSQNMTHINTSSNNFEGFQKVAKNAPLLQPGQVVYGFSDKEGNDWQKPIATNTYVENSPASGDLPKRRKSVSFASGEEESASETDKGLDSILIRFKHSDKEFQEPPTNQTTENGDIIHINSPKDIYRQFDSFLLSSEPKSILKKNSSYEGESSECVSIPPTSRPFGSSLGYTMPDEDESVEELQQTVRDLSHLPPVLRDVLETTGEPSQPQERTAEPTRRVSRFKASRSNSQTQR